MQYIIKYVAVRMSKYVAVRMSILEIYASGWAVDTASFISTSYSAIFFLSHLGIKSKIFLHMFVGSATLPCSLAIRWTEHCWKLNCIKKQIGTVSTVNFFFLRDPSAED